MDGEMEWKANLFLDIIRLSKPILSNLEVSEPEARERAITLSIQTSSPASTWRRWMGEKRLSRVYTTGPMVRILRSLRRIHET